MAHTEDPLDRSEWFVPRRGWIGGVLSFNLLLGRSGTGAVLMEDMTIYPNGLSFHLRAVLQPTVGAAAHSGLPPAPLRKQFEPTETLPSTTDFAPTKHFSSDLATDHIYFSVEFDDGRIAARDDPVGGPGDLTIEQLSKHRSARPDPSTNIVMTSSGGGPGQMSLRENYFVWPLPQGGLTVVCEWPDAQIARRKLRIEAQQLRGALTRGRPVWPQP